MVRALNDDAQINIFRSLDYIRDNAADMAQAKGDAAQWLQELPEWMQPPDASHVLSMNRAGSTPPVMCCLRAASG